MSLQLSWAAITIRLGLTVLAGILIGYNRDEETKPIGMRTTVLVGLAASVAMLEVNLLLPTAGRPTDSFVMSDLMRFPLGILTGVGFIGAGAILRRDNLVIGVTTAATIWLATVIGLCFGAGLTGLGLVATGLQLLVLWTPKWVEETPRQVEHAHLSLEFDGRAPDECDNYCRLRSGGLRILGVEIRIEPRAQHRTLTLEVDRTRRRNESEPPTLVRELAALPGVVFVSWKS
jgi:putative Mg2+ transporter-C (MgtC) family protein